MGKGEQSMDFVNVKDVVRANIMAMESNIENEIFNVGTGKSTTIKDLAYMLRDFMKSDVEPIFKSRDVLVTERRADVRKAKELLGFEANINIHDGLKEVAEDIKKNIARY